MSADTRNDHGTSGLSVPTLTAMVVGSMIGVGVFVDNLWGGETPSFSAVMDQVKGTMVITAFVFLGIEGASVYSRYARRREDVGKATVLGFVSVLCVFASVTLLSYGILPREELAELRQPSMAPLFADVVGTWGSAFISVGVVVSVLGAYLAWTLMAAEVLFIPARDHDMPSFLGRQNAAEAPITALVMSSLFVQILVVLVVIFSDDALNFLLDLCTSLALIPYFLAAAYALKLAVTGEGFHAGESRRGPLAVGLAATAYTTFLVYAAGPEFLLLSCIIYAPGTVLYVLARREYRERVFTPIEWGILAVLLGGAVTGVVMLATGSITI